MGQIGGPLRECGNCGRTYNGRINSRCPACEADARQENEA